MSEWNSRNLFYDDYWPDHWSDNDIEFVGKLLRDEFGAQLEKRLGTVVPEWELWVREEDDDV